MKNVFLLTLCGLLAIATSSAQDSIITYQRPAHVILKLAPVWLLDYDPALMGGLEVRTGKRTSVQAEFGYGRSGWSGAYPQDYEGRRAGTWRGKLEFRRYTGRYRTNKAKNIRISATYPLGNYWAVEAYGKAVNVRQRWTARDDVGPFNPITDFTSLIRRQSLTLNLKVGRQIGWANNYNQGRARVLLDVYFGAGVRFVNTIHEVPFNTPGYNASLTRGMFNRFNSNGLAVLPNVAMGLKLGFAL